MRRSPVVLTANALHWQPVLTCRVPDTMAQPPVPALTRLVKPVQACLAAVMTSHGCRPILFTNEAWRAATGVSRLWP